jgi:hypothetical protein
MGVSISATARRLGVTAEAVRKRIYRGSLVAVKDEDGHWRVTLPEQDAWDAQSAPVTLSDAPDSSMIDELVSALREQLQVKDGQIERLLDLLADSQRAVNRLLEGGR